MTGPDRVTHAHRRFGLLLRERRERLGWSLRILAKRARCSEATIRLVETAGRAASGRTLYTLLHIRELGLTADDLAQLVPARDGQRILRVELCSSAEPLAHHQLYRALLQGVGTSLRSAWAYLELASADAYRRYALLCPRRAESGAALEQVLEPIERALDGRPLDIIALGSGLALGETSLTLVLAQQEPLTCLSLGLVDLSPPLLAAGYRHAVETLQLVRNVDVWACCADLEQLTRERDLITRSGRQRLFTLLGCTLAELESEDRLLRDTLGAVAEPGDLLLLEVQLSSAGWAEPAILRARLFEWLRGPFERAGYLTVSLRLTEPRPGRWAALEREVLAEVASEESIRRWACYSMRRYERDALHVRLSESGWILLAEEPVGKPPGGLLLLCQVSRPGSRRGKAPARARSAYLPTV